MQMLPETYYSKLYKSNFDDETESTNVAKFVDLWNILFSFGLEKFKSFDFKYNENLYQEIKEKYKENDVKFLNLESYKNVRIEEIIKTEFPNDKSLAEKNNISLDVCRIYLGFFNYVLIYNERVMDTEED